MVRDAERIAHPVLPDFGAVLVGVAAPEGVARQSPTCQRIDAENFAGEVVDILDAGSPRVDLVVGSAVANRNIEHPARAELD